MIKNKWNNTSLVIQLTTTVVGILFVMVSILSTMIYIEFGHQTEKDQNHLLMMQSDRIEKMMDRMQNDRIPEPQKRTIFIDQIERATQQGLLIYLIGKENTVIFGSTSLNIPFPDNSKPFFRYTDADNNEYLFFGRPYQNAMMYVGTNIQHLEGPRDALGSILFMLGTAFLLIGGVITFFIVR